MPHSRKPFGQLNGNLLTSTAAKCRVLSARLIIVSVIVRCRSTSKQNQNHDCSNLRPGVKPRDRAALVKPSRPCARRCARYQVSVCLFPIRFTKICLARCKLLWFACLPSLWFSYCRRAAAGVRLPSRRAVSQSVIPSPRAARPGAAPPDGPPGTGHWALGSI